MNSLGGSVKRLAVGAAFFSLFFQLFLPVALAAAVDAGAPNRVLEICSIDGVRLVDFDAEDGTGEDSIEVKDLCTRCLVHTVSVPAKNVHGADLLRSDANGARAFARYTPYHPKAYISSDLTARDPPLG